MPSSAIPRIQQNKEHPYHNSTVPVIPPYGKPLRIFLVLNIHIPMSTPNPDQITPAEIHVPASTPTSPPMKSVEEMASGGIKVVFLANRKSNWVLPSTKNYFGSFELQYRYVKADISCNTLLLPLGRDEDLPELLRMFPPIREAPGPADLFKWSFATGNAAGKANICLKIEHVDGTPFPVHLAHDLSGGQHTLSIPYLRFFLSTADLQYLAEHKPFLWADWSKIENAAGVVTEPTLRRKHVLLGNLVLSQFSVVGTGAALIYVDRTVFKLQDHTWLQLDQLAWRVRQSSVNPNAFTREELDGVEGVFVDDNAVDHTIWSDEETSEMVETDE